MQEILNDVKNGKRQNWRGKKMDSELLSDSYLRIGMKNKGERVNCCGNWLDFKNNEDGTSRLHRANFCKVRLCPMCSWRRSKKIFGQVSKIMDYIEAEKKYKYIMLTLTAKNVIGEKLSDEINKYVYAFKLLTKRKEFKSVVKGWFRTLEVTHNWKREDYHPHIHAVLAVDEEYAERGKNYITHAQWIQLWRSCMELDYDPDVEVRKIKPKSVDEKGDIGAVAEVAKYTAKAGDYILKLNYEQKHFIEIDAVREELEKKTDEAVSILDTALHGRRLIANGGRFKEVHKILKLDDAIDGDLINTDNEEIRADLNYVLVRYIWKKNLQDYYKTKEL
jgi:plasmid rolling circle replication initiator protein Rep